MTAEPQRAARAESGNGQAPYSWLLELLAVVGWFLMWGAILIATISFAFISYETLLPK